MTRMRSWHVAALAGLALALAVSPPAGGAAEASKPKLRIVQQDPLLLRGMRFEPREQVRLLIVAGKPYAKRVRAGAAGGFAVPLRFVRKEPCTSIVVQAIGNQGSRAAASLPGRGCPKGAGDDGPPPVGPEPRYP
jgi:hypothetical protein